jgi:hypothetical protein
MHFREFMDKDMVRSAATLGYGCEMREFAEMSLLPSEHLTAMLDKVASNVIMDVCSHSMCCAVAHSKIRLKVPMSCSSILLS